MGMRTTPGMPDDPAQQALLTKQDKEKSSTKLGTFSNENLPCTYSIKLKIDRLVIQVALSNKDYSTWLPIALQVSYAISRILVVKSTFKHTNEFTRDENIEYMKNTLHHTIGQICTFKVSHHAIFSFIQDGV